MVGEPAAADLVRLFHSWENREPAVSLVSHTQPECQARRGQDRGPPAPQAWLASRRGRAEGHTPRKLLLGEPCPLYVGHTEATHREYMVHLGFEHIACAGGDLEEKIIAPSLPVGL